MHVKIQIARAQFDKGCGFVGAALLLKPHTQIEPYRYVYLHLICQGIELILKGLLIAKDYNKFRKKQKIYGHNILLLVEDSLQEFSLKSLSPTIKADLESLSQLFSAHTLRYGSGQDIFISPNSISIDRVVRRLGACIRLALRHLKRNGMTNLFV